MHGVIHRMPSLESQESFSALCSSDKYINAREKRGAEELCSSVELLIKYILKLVKSEGLVFRLLTSGHFVWLEICLLSNVKLSETFIVGEMPIYLQYFYYKMQQLTIKG